MNTAHLIIGKAWIELSFTITLLSKGILTDHNYYTYYCVTSCQSLSVYSTGGNSCRTGASKLSMTLGLFRIIKAAGGSIIIDDHNITLCGLQDLCSHSTIIPQDPVLLADTLNLYELIIQ